MSKLKAQLIANMKSAMKSGEKLKLSTIRLALAAVKQYEVDERKDVDDPIVVKMIGKMIKQRKDSIQQFTDANRMDLAEKEQDELVILQDYLPVQLSESDIQKEVATMIAELGASSPADMGKVMGQLKAKLDGQADMGLVSQLVKAQLF